MSVKKKFSLSIRVEGVSPSHVFISVFSGMILDEYEHEQATRGKSGNLVLSREEFDAFINHVKPHILRTISPEEDFNVDTL